MEKTLEQVNREIKNRLFFRTKYPKNKYFILGVFPYFNDKEKTVALSTVILSNIHTGVASFIPYKEFISKDVSKDNKMINRFTMEQREDILERNTPVNEAIKSRLNIYKKSNE